MVYVLLGKGFEEVEALTPVDVLRRCGVEVRLAGVGERQVTGAHGITVTADCTVEEIDHSSLEMIVVPGGLGGVETIGGSESALSAIRRAATEGCFVAAICAGPTVLAKLGITENRAVTSYPGTAPQMGRCDYREDKSVVVDGRLITSRGPATALDFGLALARMLCPASKVEQVAGDMLLQFRGKL